MDLLGLLLRSAPAFRGRGRLRQFWLEQRQPGDRRPRVLPGGATLVCDLGVPYEAMVWLREEEEQDLSILDALLKPGDVFVDGGANIGLWTLVAACRLRGTGTVWAFEPNPATFARLHANIIANDLAGCTRLLNAACGQQPGELPFRCQAAHNISQIAEQSGSDTIAVPVVTLDAALAGGPVHGMKLDVEGFELPALKGAAATLKRWKPWLCVEFNTHLAKVSQLQDWDVHRYLTGLGYGAHRFEDATRASAETRLPGSWAAQGYCNLFYR